MSAEERIREHVEALTVEQRAVMPRGLGGASRMYGLCPLTWAAFQCSWQIVNKAKRNQEWRRLAQCERNLP